MAERRENSVLFSLRELRQIEDERVKQEEQAEQARLDSERKAKDDAERRAREDEERKRREEEERVQRIAADKERQIREEQMRLEAEKHRAQVEAAARLEEARIQAETAVKVANKKAPVGLILGIVGAVVLLSGGALGYVFKVVIPEREAAMQQEQDRQIAALKSQFKDQEEALQRQQSELKSKLAATKNEAERAALEAEMRKNELAQEEAKKKAVNAIKSIKPKKPTAAKPGSKALNCDPATDPLCGSDL